MSSESKIVDPKEVDKPSSEGPEASRAVADAKEDAESSDDVDAPTANGYLAGENATAPAKKKKSKRKKIKNALTGGSSSSSAVQSQKQLTQEQLALLLEANPALKAEVGKLSPDQLRDDVEDVNGGFTHWHNDDGAESEGYGQFQVLGYSTSGPVR